MAGSVVFLRWLGWLPALTMSVLVTAWTASAVAEPSLSLGKLRWVDLEPKKLAARLDRPAVASDGSSWLTVGEGNGWLSARRFQSDGSPEGDGFQVGATDDLSRDPHLAFDGVDFVLAFQTGDGDRGIGLQRIAPNGLTPVVKLGLHGAWGDIDLAIDDSGTPQVLACDYDYVKSTCASAEVVGQQSTVHPSFDLPFPVIRVDWAFSGGTGLAVVETDAHAVALLDISADGQLLDSRLLDAATGGDALPTLAATPDGYVAAWHRSDGTRIVVLSPEGEVSAEQLVAGDRTTRLPLLLATDAHWLLLSSKSSSACDYCVNVQAQQLDPRLQDPPADPVLIVEGVYDVAAAAGADSTALLAFAGQKSLDGVLVNLAHPSPLPSLQPIAFTAPPQGEPITATAKDGWMVAWREQDEFRNVLMDSEGVARPSPIDLPATLVALEEGDTGWLMVWGSAGAQCTRLSYDGTRADASYTLPEAPIQVQIARSSAGWAVAWSRWLDLYDSALELDFFDFDGVHQSSTQLATRSYAGGAAIYSIPFDIASTADGFLVAWSTPQTDVQLLELDSMARPKGAAKTFWQWDSDFIHLAAAQHDEWMNLSNGSVDYFGPIPLEPQPNISVGEFPMELRAIGSSAVMARADRYGGYEGRFLIASAGGFLQETGVEFSTYASGYGFNFSKPNGHRALIVTQGYDWLYGTPQSRLEAAVVIVDDGLGGAGGASGAGGAGGAEGGGSEQVAGAGGYEPGDAESGGEGGVKGEAPSDTAEAGKASATTSGAGGTRSGGGTSTPSDGGDDSSASSPRLSSGCGCKLGIPRRAEHTGLALLAFSGLLVARRRRRRPSENAARRAAGWRCVAEDQSATSER